MLGKSLTLRPECPCAEVTTISICTAMDIGSVVSSIFGMNLQVRLWHADVTSVPHLHIRQKLHGANWHLHSISQL